MGWRSLALAALLAAPSATTATEPLFRVRVDGKWGYVDASGRVAIAPRFDRAEPFSEGLAAVQEGATFGYVDASGRLALVPAQAPAGTLHRRFSGGLAVVRAGSRYGYLDRSGKLAIPAAYTTAEDFSDGLALVCVDQGCGYVDRDGRGVIAPEYMGSAPAHEGWACASEAMSMGRQRVVLLRARGGRVPGTFEGCGAMSEGRIAVRTGGKWGYLDAGGRGAIAPRFEWAGDFHDGLAAAADENGLCGYVDASGAFVLPPRWRACGPFSAGRARVDLATDALEAERVAFIDRAGRVVIEGARADPPFDSAEDFRDGLAAVAAGGEPALAGDGVRLGYVDASGRWVWKPTE
jgi:hypothetical protein